MCSWALTVTEPSKWQLTGTSMGQVTPNKPDLLGILGGKRLGAVSDEGASAHCFPHPFPGQKACHLFGFHFSMIRRGRCFHHRLPGRRDGHRRGSRKGLIKALGWVSHNPHLPHSFLHPPDPPNLGSLWGLAHRCQMSNLVLLLGEARTRAAWPCPSLPRRKLFAFNKPEPLCRIPGTASVPGSARIKKRTRLSWELLTCIYFTSGEISPGRCHQMRHGEPQTGQVRGGGVGSGQGLAGQHERGGKPQKGAPPTWGTTQGKAQPRPPGRRPRPSPPPPPSFLGARSRSRGNTVASPRPRLYTCSTMHSDAHAQTHTPCTHRQPHPRPARHTTSYPCTRTHILILISKGTLTRGQLEPIITLQRHSTAFSPVSWCSTG